MLNEQLQKQIEQEAHRLYPLIGDVKKRIGYIKAAELYVEKMQAAEEKAAKYEKALKYIATFNLTSEADELDLSDAECGYNAIIETAREVITPKTGEDEMHTKP